MRVTELNMVSSFLNSVTSSRAKIDKLNKQLSTQKRVNSMSDDPAAATSALRLKDKLTQNDQYQTNITFASSMLSTTVSSLDAASDLIIRIDASLARATTATDLAPFANDMKQMFEELMQIANTNFNGKYIYGGTQTKDIPYTYDPVTNTVSMNPNGVAGSINLDVSPGIQESTNVSGAEVFNGKDTLDAVLAAYVALNNGRVPTAAERSAITAANNRILTASVKSGTSLTRLDNFQSQLEGQNTMLQSILSQAQDTDVAKAIVELQHQQTILDTSLKIGAQVIPKTLVDFI
ncbi:MAG TPA: flagellar hook-associated protein FlgL [Bacteroidota bacterium]|nr:flagellar hook-associated protein FlgL [Bacteroidota bacterium]